MDGPRRNNHPQRAGDHAVGRSRGGPTSPATATAGPCRSCRPAATSTTAHGSSKSSPVSSSGGRVRAARRPGPHAFRRTRAARPGPFAPTCANEASRPRSRNAGAGRPTACAKAASGGPQVNPHQPRQVQREGQPSLRTAQPRAPSPRARTPPTAEPHAPNHHRTRNRSGQANAAVPSQGLPVFHSASRVRQSRPPSLRTDSATRFKPARFKATRFKAMCSKPARPNPHRPPNRTRPPTTGHATAGVPRDRTPPIHTQAREHDNSDCRT